MKHVARAVAVLALLSSPVALHAQASPNIHFNIAAGLSFPTGDLGDATDAGYNLTVGLGMRPPLSPLGFRVEGMYNEWNKSSNVVGAGIHDKAHTGGVAASATYDLSTGLATGSLYGIGGLGFFSTQNLFGGSSTNLGWNIGGGFRFPLTGFSAYVEARYHNISDQHVSYVPVVFGLVF